MKYSELERIIGRVGDLPAMPEVVAEALAAADDPNSDMKAVANVIERDPGLAARILRVSNSPYFGMRQHVGTLKLAMVILGVREVRNIVLGVSLIDSLRDPITDKALSGRFWSDSFRVASMSKAVGKALSLGCQGEDFIAGLLHGIGKMVLCRHLQADYIPLLEQCSSDDELAERERAAFGFSYADVSATLGTRWNLPEPICDAIGLHIPHPERALSGARDPRLAAAVRIAYFAAREPLGDLQVAVDAALAQTEAWDALSGATGPLMGSARAESLLGIVKDIAENPPAEFG